MNKLCPLISAFIAAVSVISPNNVWAQEKYPDHPITVIVPTGPGGSTDLAIRLLSDIAGQILGTTMVIMNKPGAGGEIGVATVVRAKPDGYTIAGVWNAPLTMTPHTLPAPYTPADYIPISRSDAAPMVLCTRANFPAESGKEFVEYMKKNPDALTYGSDGIGAIAHLTAERIFSKLGVKARVIPFGGGGEELQSLLSNQIDMYGGSIAPILPYIKNNTVKCLIATSAKRVDALPQAASLTDLGIPAEETLVWHGMVAPKGTPADRIAILESAFQKAAKSDRFIELLKTQSIDADGSTSQVFREAIDSEYSAMGKITQNLGLAKNGG